MPKLRQIVLVPVVGALSLAGTLAPAQGEGAATAPPTTVVVRDGRTSPPIVDISRVRLDASWYWASEQSVRVTVPNGFRPGHRLTVWFNLGGDSRPDGHFELRLGLPKAGTTKLRKIQEFRLGGGWSHLGKKVSCTDDEDGLPVSQVVRRGQRTVQIGLDLWSCLQVPNPANLGSGSWRAAVRVAKDGKSDMAPNARRWSRRVAGWGPCDPSGGVCP